VSEIQDYSELELNQIKQILKERFGKDLQLDLADAELRLDPSTPVLTACPTVFFKQAETNFVLFKTGESRYRCLFFYKNNEQFGTGKDEYDDLQDCVITLLQVHADHELERADK